MRSQSAGVETFFSHGHPPPPLSTEPMRYFLTSAGVMLLIPAWMICPTFASRVMADSSSSMRASRFRSGGIGLSRLGQICG